MADIFGPDGIMVEGPSTFKGAVNVTGALTVNGAAVAPGVLSGAGPPTSGAAGTGAGVAAVGSFYVDTVGVGGNAIMYVNIGTLAAPTWAPVTLGDSV